jgi:endonuclease/exonuclease/phosphatase family metal-dependent hydrolase
MQFVWRQLPLRCTWVLLCAVGLAACADGDSPDAPDAALPDAPRPDGPPAPTPPETVIDAQPAALSASATATVTFSSPTAPSGGLVLGFECAADGGAVFTACTSPVTRGGQTSGSYALAVRARWVGSSVDATPATATWTVDRTPPETTISAGPSGNTAPGLASFAFTSEANATFECRLDATAFAPCTSPFAAQIALGDHTFEVRASDALGNADPSPAQREYRGDLTLATPPDTAILTQPDALSASGTATVTFTSPTVPPAGLTLGFECKNEGEAAFAGCTSPVTRRNLGSGSYALAVRARWLGGPVDATPATSAWTIDRTAPETTITAGPMGDTPVGTEMFAFTSDDAGATFECRVDATAFAACSSPSAVAVTTGNHTFEVRATDALGNVDATAAQRAYRGVVPTIDPPETRILTQPAALSANATATVTFDSPTAPTGNLVLAFECAEDGSPGFAACTSPVTRTGQGSGSYSLAIRARWVGSTIDPTPAVAAWTVDRTAPETTITSGPSGDTALGMASFAFTSEASATFECRLDAAAFAACTSPLSVQVTAGAHTFEVRASDALGNTDATPAQQAYRGITATPTKIRLMAANTTSGNLQSYDPGPGTRIFQGVKPDIVMIQEFNYRPDNSEASIRAWVTSTFGASFSYFREQGKNIPNGVISRYPILQAGVWEDALAPDREFVWARIDIPGTKDLWAISVHLLTRDAPTRNSQAGALRDLINANIPATDYLVIGGDFNTDSRAESCVATLNSSVVSNGAPYPVDQNNNGGTNASRGKPYDWVMMSAGLRALQVPTLIGQSTYTNGLVFDSRVYTPLSEVSPVLQADSGATNMQHMAVTVDVLVPAN